MIVPYKWNQTQNGNEHEPSNVELFYFQFGTIFCLSKSDYVYDLKFFDDDFEFDQKIYYFKSLIMYLILVHMFNEILLFKQYYGINNFITIKIIINTIIIVITVVLKLFQHYVMQHHYQYLVLQ